MQHTIQTAQAELAEKSQRGITFILAASFYWTGVGLAGIYLRPNSAFIVSLWGTGILFPLSILLAKVMRIEIFFKNELTPLGLWANVFQLFFFPIFFLSSKANIGYPLLIMGVLAGAHFVFYHWLYQSRTYLLLAFAVALNSYITGLLFLSNTYVALGLSNGCLLLMGALGLAMENRTSSSSFKSSTTKTQLK